MLAMWPLETKKYFLPGLTRADITAGDRSHQTVLLRGFAGYFKFAFIYGIYGTKI
jgi:hypothetical protein